MVPTRLYVSQCILVTLLATALTSSADEYGCCYATNPTHSRAHMCPGYDSAACRRAERYSCAWSDDGSQCGAATTAGPDGCCYPSNTNNRNAQKCYNYDIESDCNRMSRWGCAWMDGVSDCTAKLTPAPVEPGCCFGENERKRMYMSCYDIGTDRALCDQRARQWGCGWKTGTTDCSLPTTTTTTEEPGCCAKGMPSNRQAYRCEDVDEKTCNQWANRAQCEWRVGDDPRLCADPTAQPTMNPIPTTEPTRAPIEGQSDCPTNHRHRKPWQTISDKERELYIDGFKILSEMGVTQKFTESHIENAEHSNSEFLPWHREYIYLMENAIRSLGGEYSCFTLPYWDWTLEPTPADVAAGASLFILDSGLGGDGAGECLDDVVWGNGSYAPYTASRVRSEECLIRDVDYVSSAGTCTFYSASQVMDLIDYSPRYQFFRPFLEGTPHPLPHVCVGGPSLGDMATLYSPNDPIFFVHHSFVDFIWALWQDCYDYDGEQSGSRSDAYSESVDYLLRFDLLPEWVGAEAKAVSETLDIYRHYDVSYEKGPFWENAFVDGDGNCGRDDGVDPINPQWFYNEEASLKSDWSPGRRFERSSNAISRAIWRNLREKYPDAPLRDLVAEWAEEVCLLEQMDSGLDCPVPDELPDCSSFPVDPDTNDIIISLDEMLNPDEFELTECQISTRRALFNWAEIMNQRRYLCEGCLDPICQRRALMESGRCTFDSMEHAQDDEEPQSVLLSVIDELSSEMRSATDCVASNVQMVIIVVAALLILVAKRCLDRSQQKRMRMKMDAAASGGLGYGAVY